MKSSIILLALSSLLIGDSFAAASQFVVASNLLDSQLTTSSWTSVGVSLPSINVSNSSVGQAFTAQSTGVLTTVDALVAVGSQATAGFPELHVSVYTSNAGIPVSQLATLSFQRSQFGLLVPSSADNRETFDFSQSNVLLESGHEYFVAFESPFAVSGQFLTNTPYFVGWSPDSYFGSHSLSLGVNFSFAPNASDWSVRTDYAELGIVVRAIPEPSTFLLGFVAFATLPCRRQKTASPQSRLACASSSLV